MVGSHLLPLYQELWRRLASSPSRYPSTTCKPTDSRSGSTARSSTFSSATWQSITRPETTLCRIFHPREERPAARKHQNLSAGVVHVLRGWKHKNSVQQRTAAEYFNGAEGRAFSHSLSRPLSTLIPGLRGAFNRIQPRYRQSVYARMHSKKVPRRSGPGSTCVITASAATSSASPFLDHSLSQIVTTITSLSATTNICLASISMTRPRPHRLRHIDVYAARAHLRAYGPPFQPRQ